MTLEELEAIYMDGCADEVGGNVDFGPGHVYRVGNQLVHTNSQGFHEVEDYENEELAHEAMRDFLEPYAEIEDDPY